MSKGGHTFLVFADWCEENGMLLQANCLRDAYEQKRWPRYYTTDKSGCWWFPVYSDPQDMTLNTVPNRILATGNTNSVSSSQDFDSVHEAWLWLLEQWEEDDEWPVVTEYMRNRDLEDYPPDYMVADGEAYKLKFSSSTKLIRKG